MADIFVRPYDQQHRSPKRLIVTALVVLAVSAAVTGFWIWIDSRPAKAPEAKQTDQPVAKPSPVAPSAVVAPVSGGEAKAQQLFTRAQGLVAAGKLEQADDLLGKAASTASDASLRNDALRVQGRIHVKLFLSSTPTSWKKTYVIQPGDSLNRIARRNKTTVDLIRKMNDIEGDLIYPGRHLLLPAAPFVVRVDKSAKTLDLTMNGKLFKRYSVGLGVNGRTPTGTFHTVVHQKNPDWTPPGGGIIPFGDPRNLIGTRWMSIQDPTRPDIKGFGIHGTPARDSIGTDTSNGCIRMLNEDVEEVFMLIPRGTEVVISE